MAGRRFNRENNITIYENKQKHKRRLFLFNDLILVAKSKKSHSLLASDNEDYLLFCQTFYLKKLKIIDHADTDGCFFFLFIYYFTYELIFNLLYLIYYYFLLFIYFIVFYLFMNFSLIKFYFYH